jgi:acyl-CoA thioester hydrolase
MTGSAIEHGIVEFRVRYSETDQMQVVYHANYLTWCEIGRTELIRQIWGSYADLERMGVALAVVEATVRYHAAARYDNLVRVRTTLREVKSRSVTFDYLMENAETGRRFATASTTLVGFTPAGAVAALPQAVREALERHAGG